MDVFWKMLKKMFKDEEDEEPVMVKYEENVDYIFQKYGEQVTGMVLLKEPYDGVFFYFGGIKYDQVGEVNTLHFEYTIVDSGIWTVEELQDDKEFHTMMGDILTGFLTEEVLNGQIRKDNPKESDSQ
jgi:hypothetical protein